jgi:hypothetical protein
VSIQVISPSGGGAAGAIVSSRKAIIPAEETRGDTSYGPLETPDLVEGIVLPEDGLILVAYQAQWKSSVAGAGRAAIFLGENQLKTPSGTGGAPVEQVANTHSSIADRQTILAMNTNGLHGHLFGSSSDAGDSVATGQSFPFPLLCVFAAAGTYDVSVRFAATSGSVVVKNRALRVWSQRFD